MDDAYCACPDIVRTDGRSVTGKLLMHVLSYIPVIDADEMKAMEEMKTSLGPGCDGIASFVIKIALSLISGSLCDLFNMSLFSGKFSADLKTVRVAPTYKSGVRDDCSKP